MAARRAARGPQRRGHRRLSLLVQILAVNALLVSAAVLVAGIGARFDPETVPGTNDLLVLGLAILGTLLANALLLRRRLAPLEELIESMERVDLTSHAAGVDIAGANSEEVQRLLATFNRLLGRLEAERRDAGAAVLYAQEHERRRIAQDLHDEVNQALTAILLRLEAAQQDAPGELRAELGHTKELAQQAMDELLTIARQLRPTALDEYGLLPALRSQVEDFASRTGIRADFRRHGPVPPLSDDQQLVIYRVVQESLNNVAQHSGATEVLVELETVGRTVARVRDNGRGMPEGARESLRADGLGLSGMHERALLAGGWLSIDSRPGSGTTVTLTIGES